MGSISIAGVGLPTRIVYEESLGMDEATLKDLAFGFRSSKEVDEIDLRVCLSAASYAAAEKNAI
jgi:hypothetical protein